MKIVDRVFSIEVPQLPNMTVNCYLLDTGSGWIVIDAGVNASAVRKTWDESLESMGIDYSQIKTILLTHHHLDHLGAAGWLQQKSGARVFILDIEIPYATRYTEDIITNSNAFEFFQMHGYTQFDTSNPIINFRQSVQKLTSPLPVMEKLQDGQVLDCGAFRLEVIWTPGHSPGHICFYDREKRYLFSGDFLLPDISSHVGFYPGGTENPLRDVLQSMQKMRGLGAELVFPGHGPVFTDPDARIDEILEHHRKRTERVYSLLDRPKNVASLNDVIFGPRDPFNTFLAVGETAAHLELLIDAGRVVKEMVDGVLMFART